MNSTKQISAWQFTAFRILFGVYLSIHFAQLLPYAGELFGSRGVLADPRLNPLHGLLPNPLAYITWPAFPVFFISLLVIISVAFTAGLFRRSSAILLWFGWACLFNRNNLIANPGIPYVGLLLILCALVPPGEPLSIRRRRESSSQWNMPSVIYWGAWLLLAVGYTFSGVWKLFSPSWVDGTALMHLLQNPLARPGVFRDLLLDFPALLRVLTWVALAGEILFLVLCITRRGRLIAWLWMLLMHAGILLVVDFADLTFGMLVIHFFVFDPEWIPARRSRAVVLFDGTCGLCNRWVQFITREEREPVFDFASLQSDAGQTLLRKHQFNDDYRESIVVIEMTGERVFTKSSAVLRVFAGLGGFWRLLTVFAMIPRSSRDWLYDQIAQRRHQLFEAGTTCAIGGVAPHRFLQTKSPERIFAP